MKFRSLFALAIVAVLAACPAKPDTTTPPDTTVVPPVVVDTPAPPVVPTEPRFVLGVSQDGNDVSGTVSWDGAPVIANITFSPKKGTVGKNVDFLTLADGKYAVRLKDGEYTICANIYAVVHCRAGTITVPLY